MPEDELVQSTNTTPNAINVTLNVAELKAGLNPTGRDPDLELKAEEYAKRSWQLDFEPVLKRTGLIQDLTLVAVIQDELFKLKYEYLEKSESTKQSAQEAGLRWGIKA